MALAPLAHVLFTRVMSYDAVVSRLARSRPLRAVGRPRVDPAVLDAATSPATGSSSRTSRQFRQWGSHTPGHPEVHHTKGVETTTGPLGQGFATARRHGHRRALAARPLRSRADRSPHLRVCSDGDLMEGVSHEAGVGRRSPRPRSAGLRLRRQPHHDRRPDRAHLQRRRRASGSRRTAGTSTTSARSPTTATRWRPRSAAAKAVEDKPSLIVLRSHIGWPSPNATDTAEAHGTRPRRRRGAGAPRRSSACPPTRRSGCPTRCWRIYREAGARGRGAALAWEERLAAWDGDRDAYRRVHRGPRRSTAGTRSCRRSRPARSVATRVALNKCLNAVADVVPGLVSGGADLTGNTGTQIKPADQQSKRAARRSPDGLRHPRARHGGGDERHGAARRRHPRRRHVLRVLRLHAPGACGSPR